MPLQGFIHLLLWAFALLGFTLHFAWTDMVSSDWKEIFKFLFKCITLTAMILYIIYLGTEIIKNACL